MEFADEIVRQRERLFFARVPQERRPVENIDGMHESDGIAAWRWWTLAELDATSEVIWPADLTELIRAATAPP
jgi:hypothetical protein